MEESPSATVPSSGSSISSSLLQRVQSQDPAAWQRLVTLYTPVVYQWCRRSELQADDAADVSQEVFVAVARRVADFRRDRPQDSFRGWLWTITRNKICDHFRRLADRPQPRGGTPFQDLLVQIPTHPPESPSTAGQPGQLSGVARRASELVRAEFEDRTWQAFWRTTVDRQPTAAVANELDMTKSAVLQAKSRVMRRLRRELEGLGEGGGMKEKR